MKNSSGTTVWILGAFLISALFGAGAYSLLISPQLSSASTAKSDLADVKEFNDLLDIQILTAQSKAEEVDSWYSQIAAIQVDMPPTPEQAAFERMLNESLQLQGLPTVAVVYGTATSVAPTPLDIASSLGADPVAEAPSTSTTPSPAPTPSANPIPEDTAIPDVAAPVEDSALFIGLLQTPVTITTEGTPQPIMRFLLDMQTQNDRFFTVTNFDIQRATTTDAGPGRPALAEGDWIINITGLIFNLYDGALSLPIKESASTPPYKGDTVPNPFIPIPGTETAAAR